MATSTAKTAIVLSVVGTLAVTGIHQGHQASVLKKRVQTLEQEQAGPAAQIIALLEQNRQLQERHTRLQQTLDEQKLQKSGNDASEKNPSTSPDQQNAAAAAREKAAKAKLTALADGQEFVTTNSQGRAILIDIGRAQIARNYAGFYRMAKLSPAQIEDFENETNAYWLSTTVMTPTSIHPDKPVLPDDRARAILGEEGFAQFQQFQRIQPVQNLVNAISSLSTDAPLSRDQSAQLLTIMANASPAYRSGAKADPKTIDWNQVEAEARSVLNASQLEALHAQSQFPRLTTLIKEFYENRPPAK
jgi:regulator of replication initiation timing